MKNKYRFDVPGEGVREVQAQNIDDAFMELADQLGIRLVGSIEYGSQPAVVGKPMLRLVKTDKSLVSVNA